MAKDNRGCDPCRPFNRIKYCGNGVQGTNIQEGDNFQTILDKLIQGSGGGFQPNFTVTRLQLETLVNNDDLVPNALYNITDADTQYLYGGTSIFLRAITTNELEEYGMGMFYNPKYDQNTAGFGVALDYSWWAQPADQLPSGVYSISDDVIWGGYHWECIQPTTNSTKYILDDFELDQAYFIKKPFNNLDYNVVYDVIRYDYANDMIIVRDNGNIKVEFDYNWLYYFTDDVLNVDMHYDNPIRNMQWGNDFDYNNYAGVLNVNIYKSVHRYINFQGSYLKTIICLENSYQINLTFGQGSSQAYLAFGQFSKQINTTFGQNSYQINLTFGQGSYQTNTTFGQNSYQNYITFGQNSYQTNTTFGQGSKQEYITFRQFSKQINTTFGQNSYQNYITFGQNSSQYNTTFGQGSKQEYITFGQGSLVNWNNQTITQNIENVYFHSGIYSINNVNNYPFLLDNRYKEVYCDSNGEPYTMYGKSTILLVDSGNLNFEATRNIFTYNVSLNGNYNLADGLDLDIGKEVYVINESGFNFDINGNIFDNGLQSSKTLSTGMSVHLIWSGGYWAVI